MEEREISSCHPVMSSFPDRPLLRRVLLQTTRRLMETCCWSLIGEPEKGRGELGWRDEGKEVAARVEVMH